MVKASTILIVVAIALLLVIGAIYYLLYSVTSTPSSISRLVAFTTSTANVRSCGSMSCPILGTYDKGVQITLADSYRSFSQVPDWVRFTYPDEAGREFVGYIHKSLLATEQLADTTAKREEAPTATPPVKTVQQSSTSTRVSIPDAVKEWRPKVVRILCSDQYYTSTGSGVLLRMNFSTIGVFNAPTLITNKHVVTDAKYNTQFTACSFQVPDTDAIYNVTMSAEKDAIGQDVAYFPSMSENPPVGAKSGMRTCNPDDVMIGDDIVVLGYPSIGGTGPASTALTALTGIISSYDGEYYVTDAKIDHGNSGGAVILLKNNCFLGIPTWAQAGSFESLGRILSAKYIFD